MDVTLQYSSTRMVFLVNISLRNCVLRSFFLQTWKLPSHLCFRPPLLVKNVKHYCNDFNLF